jgi:uncharacterized repeat protein (TIGR01451 family)
VAKTATEFVNVNADGLAFDASTNTLYAALYSNAGGPDSQIAGYNVQTMAQVFNSGTIPGRPGGVTVGTGSLAGNLFVNTNGGTIVEINLATKAQTTIASGGSRGDFVTVDSTSGTLLVSQTDRILRLIPPSSGDFLGGGNIVEANLVGTDLGGKTAVPNQGNGVAISGTAAGNSILDNVISGNQGHGVFIKGSPGINVVSANFIGADGAGNVTPGIPNGDHGIEIDNSPSNTISKNLIARNVSYGIELDDPQTEHNVLQDNNVVFNGAGGVLSCSCGSGGNQFLGNIIGTDPTGKLSEGNSGDGLVVGTPNNTIGGSAAGAPNVIAFNTGLGVGLENVATNINNLISQNAIYGNGGLGIDLGEDGVTANTPGGPHTGPNDLQNFPVLNPFTVGAGGTLITGTLNSAPNQDFTIEFFANPAADPSGYGQGQTFLGRLTNIPTNASGNALFQFTASGDLTGQFITATAIDASDNTSEFSADVGLARADLAVLDPTATPSSFSPGGQITYGITVKNLGPDTAVNVLETVQVPAYTHFVSLSAPAGTTVNLPPVGAEGPFNITATAPTAPANRSVSFTLVVRVDPLTPAGTMITDSASVSSDTPDPVSANNIASATNTVFSATPSPTPTPTPTSTPAPAPTSPVTITSFVVEKVKVGTGRHATRALALGVGFSGPLSATAAQNLAAYTVFSGKVKKVHKMSQVLYNSSVPLNQAIYSSASDTLALLPRGKHALPKLEQLHVNVSILTDPSGRPINYGKNFTATVTNAGLIISADRITATASSPVRALRMNRFSSLGP